MDILGVIFSDSGGIPTVASLDVDYCRHGNLGLLAMILNILDKMGRGE